MMGVQPEERGGQACPSSRPAHTAQEDGMARVYDRFLSQRLSRRRRLGASAAAGLSAAAIAAVGCRGDGGTTTRRTPSANETPTTDGVLRIRQPANVPLPSMSPFGLTALISSLIFGYTTYDHLWYVPIDTGEIELMLAENVEIVDEQGLGTIVTIREAYYHDKPPVSGRQVLATDVPPGWAAVG